MRRLKRIYPEYSDQVSFYAVGVFPGEDINMFEEFRVEKGYPWPVAIPLGDLLTDFKVTIQSTKIAFDSQGVIVHRNGMGQGSDEVWHEVFHELAASG